MKLGSHPYAGWLLYFLFFAAGSVVERGGFGGGRHQKLALLAQDKGILVKHRRDHQRYGAMGAGKETGGGPAAAEKGPPPLPRWLLSRRKGDVIAGRQSAPRQNTEQVMLGARGICLGRDFKIGEVLGKVPRGG